MMSIRAFSSSCIFPPSKKGKKNAWIWYSSNKETSNIGNAISPWRTVITNKGPTGETGVSWGIGWIREAVLRDLNRRTSLSRDLCFRFLKFSFLYSLAENLKEWYFFIFSPVQFIMKVRYHDSLLFPTLFGTEKCVYRHSNIYEGHCMKHQIDIWEHEKINFLAFVFNKYTSSQSRFQSV